jgi:hypothetical protein
MRSKLFVGEIRQAAVEIEIIEMKGCETRSREVMTLLLPYGERTSLATNVKLIEKGSSEVLPVTSTIIATASRTTL